MGHAIAAAHVWSAGDGHPQHLVVTPAENGLSQRTDCLVPADSFAEHAPEPTRRKKNRVVWFAFNEGRPLFTSMFLATAAMLSPSRSTRRPCPVILTTDEERRPDAAPSDEAKVLQRPLSDKRCRS